MPNNPGSRRAGAVQVSNGNKIVRGTSQAVAIKSSSQALQADIASQQATTKQDTTSTSAAAVPPGAIIMWSGTLSSIPAGWVLCNGTNGTPDLRDKFVKGAAAATNPGTTGGTVNHTPAGAISTPSTGGSLLLTLTGTSNLVFTGTSADYQPPFYCVLFLMKS